MTVKGSLVVVSGFSGVGKGSVMKSLISRYEGYALSVSATTREPRPGEVEGREYFFISRDEFLEMIENDELVEYASYCDNYYGTPRRFVTQKLEQGQDVLLEIEIQGALKIKKQFPEALLIFIMPPSVDELMNRLLSRGTESEEAICKRIERAVEEAGGIEDYDYIYINDRIDDCADRMNELIRAQRNRTSRNSRFIEEIRQQISHYKSEYSTNNSEQES